MTKSPLSLAASVQATGTRDPSGETQSPSLGTKNRTKNATEERRRKAPFFLQFAQQRLLVVMYPQQENTPGKWPKLTNTQKEAKTGRQ